jgi:hypothetical protein
MTMNIGTRNIGRLVTLSVIFTIAIAAAACSKSTPKPGQADFDKANDVIASFSSDVGFGNTPAAVDMAKKVAVRIKKREAETFTGGKDDENDPITHGNFLTYCEVQGSVVTFLVQAPNLDTYEGDVRKALFEIAWEATQSVLAKAADKTLVVALRGKLLYGAIGKGKANAAAPTPTMGTAVEESDLYAYFAPQVK